MMFRLLDLAPPQITGNKRPIIQAKVLTKPDDMLLVRQVSAILDNKDVDTLKMKKMTKLVQQYGISMKAVAYAMRASGFGKSGGTAPSPSARIAINGIRPTDRLAVAAAKAAAAQELSYRAAFIINTARRMQTTLNTVADQEFPDAARQLVKIALRDQSVLYQKHESARRNRLDAAAQSGKMAEFLGSDLVGWYLNPALNNESECIAADGNNYYASQGTVLGWPGAVHPNCGCTSGPAHENGGMVNDAVNHMMSPGTVQKVFKLKRKAS